jgi:thiol-disulfide isomerase/thioredoxin
VTFTRANSGARVRAPELTASGTWLNTATPLRLADLRGRFVLLDFWTFCCANCLHVLDELRPLEAAYGDVLTVIGVHSPKFAHEADPAAVSAAVARYDVHHPVVNDPQLRLWQQYAVKAWPTLVLIDPAGYVVSQAAGEGHASAIAATLDKLIPEFESGGLLRRGDGTPLTTGNAGVAGDALRFPSKAIVLPAQRTGRAADSLLVADAGHHQLAELTLDGATVLRRIGSGTRGLLDGPADGARFAEPNGLALLPPGFGYDVVVADTANHVLRGMRLSDGTVVATVDLPELLRDARTVTGPVPGVLSPWDVAWWPARERLVVAAAGVHLLLEVDPAVPSASVLAGNTVEGLQDGPATQAWLAQPSGLAVDGERVWFVDSETSALRYLSADDTVHTAVGEGLFDFGHVDGAGSDARLQHPLGVTVLRDGSVAVLDTYNGAVRRYAEGQVSTVASGLAEPSGAVLVDGELVVVESAAHRLTRPALGIDTVAGSALSTQRPASPVRAGAVRLDVRFTPAPGRKLDDRFGPSTRLTVSASPPELLISGAGDGVDLYRDLVIDHAVPNGTLHITAQGASCDADEGVEHPACYLARQDWGVPVTVTPDGPDRLELVLLG